MPGADPGRVQSLPVSAPSPFLVPVRDLVRRPGEMRDRDLVIPLPEKWGEGAAHVAEGTDLDLALRIEGLHEGVLVTADVTTVATGECVRCLDPVTLPVEVDFQELFAYSPTGAVDEESSDFVVRDDHVDLEPVVRDAVVLALPFQPVCRPDCPGLDPETGEKLTDDTEADPVDVPDPRWAALEGFHPGNDEKR